MQHTVAKESQMKSEEWVKNELNKASVHHKHLCELNPVEGSMFDKAAYIALGRISAFEEILKGE